MKAIVKGRLYDTDKSEEIAKTSSSEGFSHITESLHRSPNFKQLFIARAEYDSILERTKSSIRLIRDDEEAIEWLTAHGVADIEAYEALGIEIEEA